MKNVVIRRIKTFFGFVTNWENISSGESHENVFKSSCWFEFLILTTVFLLVNSVFYYYYIIYCNNSMQTVVYWAAGCNNFPSEKYMRCYVLCEDFKKVEEHRQFFFFYHIFNILQRDKSIHCSSDLNLMVLYSAEKLLLTRARTKRPLCFLDVLSCISSSSLGSQDATTRHQIIWAQLGCASDPNFCSAAALL